MQSHTLLAGPSGNFLLVTGHSYYHAFFKSTPISCRALPTNGFLLCWEQKPPASAQIHLDSTQCPPLAQPHHASTSWSFLVLEHVEAISTPGTLHLLASDAEPSQLPMCLWLILSAI